MRIELSAGDHSRLAGPAVAEGIIMKRLAILAVAALLAGTPGLPASASPAGAKERFLADLQQALGRSDGAWLAGHIDYPLTVRGRHRALIKSKYAFLTSSPGLLGPKLRADVMAQRPQDLFSNWQGMMIGSGDHNIWVHDASPDPSRPDYRIFAINGAN